MEAKALADLVEEPKGVVTRITPNKNEAKLIGKKWDARKDLKGKTKSEIIELLFDDVKSVIKDSGTQYQIYSIFSFQKQIPDESSSTQTKEGLRKMSKAELVDKLVDFTNPMHILVKKEDALPISPEFEESEKEFEEDEKKTRNRKYDEILKKNKKLTHKQKKFVRANYDQLEKIVDQLIDESNAKYFPFEQWIKESLQKNYPSKFTKEELTELIIQFQGAEGQKFLETIQVSDFVWSHMEMMEKNAPADQAASTKEAYKKFRETANYKKMAAEREEYLKFVGTNVGRKFIIVYGEETGAYLESEEEEAKSKHPEEGGYSIIQTENMNKIFNKFVEENYKK